jgi:hypothetical protein
MNAGIGPLNILLDRPRYVKEERFPIAGIGPLNILLDKQRYVKEERQLMDAGIVPLN